jgi:cell division protein FtsW (lipid II flippase)
MNITNEIGLVELLWSLAIVFGLVAEAIRIASVYGDLRARKRSKRNGLMKIQVRSDLRNEVARFMVLACLTPLAYIFLTTINRPHPWHFDIILVALVCLLAIPFILLYDAVRTQQTRQQILRALDKEDYKNHTHGIVKSSIKELGDDHASSGETPNSH